MDYSTVKLTGTWTDLLGNPSIGSAQIIPSTGTITTPDGFIIGRKRVALVGGELDVEVPDPADPTLVPQGFTYTILVNLQPGYWKAEDLTLAATDGTYNLREAPSEKVTEYVDAADLAAVRAMLEDLETPPQPSTQISLDTDGTPYFTLG